MSLEIQIFIIQLFKDPMNNHLNILENFLKNRNNHIVGVTKKSNQ